MASNPQVLGLLEEMLDAEKTPEEVCCDCPELLPEVRQRWQEFQLIDGQVRTLLPGLAKCPGADTITSVPAPGDLPDVPGYEVEAVLGQGGMGVVYRARQRALDRLVAIKMLLAGPFASSQELGRFRRETEALACLRHPNIVQVYDAGDVEGGRYFAMELVEGGSLAQKVAGTPQPARPAAALVTAMAWAVEVAHKSGIVHRDLKPSNILLTADGTPKISDFGLARRLGGQDVLTRTGAALGTPSYMAPEQARGQAAAIGPAVDVYALGAILYELITGRPPFRAESEAETIRQVMDQEPVPPSRLNRTVPRDLETICLKCLHKEPERRYASAAALADDLNCFLDGRSIRARPLGWGARLWRWIRRNPVAASQAGAALTLAGLTLGSVLWLERQRVEQRAETDRQQAELREETARQEGRESQVVETVLEQARTFLKQDRWPDARAALERASSPLGPSVSAVLWDRVRQARKDVDMVAELEAIRLRLLEGKQGHEKVATTGDQLYAEAFRNYGIDLTMLEPPEAATRIRNSAICETLLTYLHEWLYGLSGPDRDRLRAVLDRADDDEWRKRIRKVLHSYRQWDPKTQMADDTLKLKDLMKARESTTQPPVVISGLSGILFGGPLSKEALALLRDAQQRHPGDFWINFQLGYSLQYDELPQEAVIYSQVAVAIRPGSAQAYTLLGRGLFATGNVTRAIAAFRKAAALDPIGAGAKDLTTIRVPRDGLEEACLAWEKILEHQPPAYDCWYGYAQLCLFLGKEQEYRRARKALLERFGETNDWIVAERSSMACLLLPASGDELRRSVALADRALAAAEKSREPGNPYVQFVKGLAEYRKGRVEQAIPWLEQSASGLPNRPGPRLVLAMAQFQSGSARAARRTLAAAVQVYPWDESPPVSQTDLPVTWVSHVLRREAEAMILPNLPAFLDGKYQPQDNDERLALLGICQFQGRYGAAARLYADAFAADPQLADDLNKECLRRTGGREAVGDRIEAFNSACRYLAARCAALAGCGQGKDGESLSAEERTRWRDQARDWLQADLAAWAKMLDSDSQAARDLAKRILEHWQVDPDLAGLRDPLALEKLPPDERQKYHTLWNTVAAARNQVAVAAPADNTSGINDEGFIQRWLVLAPIPHAESQSGADALDKDQVKEEAKLKVKAGDTVKVGDKAIIWKKHTCKDCVLDFNFLLSALTEDSVAYAVSYVVAPEELESVKMKTGSDDQAKVYLNGKQVFRQAEVRAIEKDADSTEVTLQKGVNVLVIKVINEKVHWAFCLRFTDKDDNPLTILKAHTQLQQ
jgi:serine/threonine-protein kinase